MGVSGGVGGTIKTGGNFIQKVLSKIKARNLKGLEKLKKTAASSTLLKYVIISIDGDTGSASTTHLGVGFKKSGVTSQQSAALGYGDTEDLRVGCTLNGIELATTSDNFLCYTYIAAGTGCGIHQARLSIIFLGETR